MSNQKRYSVAEICADVDKRQAECTVIGCCKKPYGTRGRGDLCIDHFYQMRPHNGKAH